MKNLNAPSVIVKTRESEVKTDKNGRTYVTTGFQKLGKQQVMIAGKMEDVQDVIARATAINLYNKSYLNNLPSPGRETKIGGFIFGDIVTKEVPAYKVPQKQKDGSVKDVERTTYTTVVFGFSNSESWDSAIAQAFKSAGHPLTEAPAPVVETRDASTADANA